MIKKNIATNEFGFVFNPATGDSFNSNPIAAEIIKLMKENQSLNEIKKVMISSEAKLNPVKIKESVMYDFPTEAGKTYILRMKIKMMRLFYWKKPMPWL